MLIYDYYEQNVDISRDVKFILTEIVEIKSFPQEVADISERVISCVKLK
jgi:hypothetical protein